MPCQSSSLNSILGLVMIVGLKMTHISSENSIKGILSDVSSSSYLISLFRRTSVLNWYTWLTPRGTESAERWTRAIGGRIYSTNFFPEWRLYRSSLYSTCLTWQILLMISMHGCWISQLVLFAIIYAANLKSMPGFWLGWFHVPQMVPKTWTKHGITQLEMCRLKLGIFTSLVLASNEIVMMDSGHIVTLCWVPGLGIIQNRWQLLKSRRAYSRRVKFLPVRRWGIEPVVYSIGQDTTMFTWSCWRT